MADDERNERWRQAVAFLVAGAIVAAVGLSWIATDGGETSNAADDATTGFGEPVPWDGGRLDRDRLTLYFTGMRPAQAGDPCSRAYAAVAEPTDDMMVVTVRALAGSPVPPGQGCEDIGYDRSVTVDLPEPLEGRPVVDGASGQQRTVSNAAELLTPSWLPAGYHLSWEYVHSEIDTYLDTRQWVVDGQPDVRLLVEQGDVDEVGRPGLDPVVLDRPTVRGVPATVWKTKGFDDLVCVSWVERSVGIRVCSSGTPGQLLPNGVLIRVAKELRGDDSHESSDASQLETLTAADASDNGAVDASQTTAGDAMSEAATAQAGSSSLHDIRRELDHLAASDGRIQALGNTGDAVSVELRPDAESLAARLDDEYSDAVELLLGGVPYPPSKIPDDFDGCPSPPVEPWPRGVTTSLELDDERVPQGGSTRGVVTVRNMSGEPFMLDVEDPVWGWVYEVGEVSPPLGHPGVVYTALGSGGSEPSGPRRDLASGESTSVSVPIGTASCHPARGYALAPGVYDVRVQFGVRDGTAHVSQPARLRVTHR